MLSRIPPWNIRSQKFRDLPILLSHLIARMISMTSELFVFCWLICSFFKLGRDNGLAGKEILRKNYWIYIIQEEQVPNHLKYPCIRCCFVQNCACKIPIKKVPNYVSAKLCDSGVVPMERMLILDGNVLGITGAWNRKGHVPHQGSTLLFSCQYLLLRKNNARKNPVYLL